jgi:hypothetical protein
MTHIERDGYARNASLTISRPPCYCSGLPVGQAVIVALIDSGLNAVSRDKIDSLVRETAG